MAQLNLNVTDDFERALKRLMRLRGLTSKSEAVRLAVQEAADRAGRAARTVDFGSLRGIGLRAPLNASPRFASEDDLWQ